MAIWDGLRKKGKRTTLQHNDTVQSACLELVSDHYIWSLYGDIINHNVANYKNMFPLVTILSPRTNVSRVTIVPQ